MGTEYYAICRETKKYYRCGRFYEWSGIDRRDWKDKEALESSQVAVGYGYMFGLVLFMYEHQGRMIEIVIEDVLFELRHDGGWEELLEDGKTLNSPSAS